MARLIATLQTMTCSLGSTKSEPSIFILTSRDKYRTNYQVLEEEAAIQVKNEALRSLKERLLTRATIIQRRLDGE